MTVIATALKHMLAAGMPHDAIVAAVAEMEASAVPAERPRSKGAERQARYMERKRHKASQSVTNDADDVSGDEKRHSDPLPCPPKDNNSNPPTHPRDKPIAREAAEAHVAAWQAWRVKNPFPRPHWADREVWSDFLAVRKRKDMVNTPTAHRRLLRDMAAAVERTRWPPGRIFVACVEQGWGAIYDTDEMKAVINANGNGDNRRSARHGRPAERDRGDGLTRALDAEIRRARTGDEAGRSGPCEGGGVGELPLAAAAAVR